MVHPLWRRAKCWKPVLIGPFKPWFDFSNEKSPGVSLQLKLIRSSLGVSWSTAQYPSSPTLHASKFVPSVTFFNLVACVHHAVDCWRATHELSARPWMKGAIWSGLCQLGFEYYRTVLKRAMKHTWGTVRNFQSCSSLPRRVAKAAGVKTEGSPVLAPPASITATLIFGSSERRPATVSPEEASVLCFVRCGTRRTNRWRHLRRLYNHKNLWWSFPMSSRLREAPE